MLSLVSPTQSNRLVETANPSLVLNTLATAVTPIIWGSTYLVTSEWLPANQPFTAALIRTLPAGLLLLLAGSRPRVPRQEWGRLLILSALNIGLFQALLFVAAYRLPGGIAAIVGATMPLFVMALVWTFDGRRPALIALGSAFGAIVGMGLIFARSHSELDPWGVAAAIAGTACLGLGTYLSQRWRSSVPLLSFTGWQLVLASLVLAPLAYIAEPPVPPLTTENLLGFAYLSIFGAMLGYPLWFRGIARLSAPAVSALGLLSPLTATALGWWVLGQSLSAREGTGIAIVLSTVLLLQWANRPRSSLHPSIQKSKTQRSSCLP